jgi:CRISPR-associated protein Cas5d
MEVNITSTPSHCIEVWGDFACFTRPEMKVERVSYEVMTPSAARAIFESILWKPAIRWRISRIEVLKPIKWMSLRRNEVGAVIPVSNVTEAMARGSGHLGLYIEYERQQRAGLFLRDVAYRISGTFELTSKVGGDDSPVKFAEMFKRRAKSGQCFNQPYLGCREFSCAFRYVEDAAAGPPPEEVTRDLGLMLYDLDFSDPTDPQPLFFGARLERGVMNVPPWGSPEVLR